MAGDIATALRSDDPEQGLRAVGTLHRLAEHVEAAHVRVARQHGWSWEQIADALGVPGRELRARYRRLVP